MANKKGVVEMKAESVSQRKKFLFFAGIVVALLMVVSLFLFMGKGKTAGQAVFTGSGSVVGSAGFSGNVDTILNKQSFDFVVGADLGTKQSVAYSFDLEYPSNKLTFVSLKTPKSTWGTDFWNYTITAEGNGKSIIHFKHGTIDYNKAINGSDKELAIIKFQGNLVQADLVNITFNNITVVDFDSSTQANIITNLMQPGAETPTIQSTKTVSPTGVSPTNNTVVSSVNGKVTLSWSGVTGIIYNIRADDLNDSTFNNDTTKQINSTIVGVTNCDGQDGANHYLCVNGVNTTTLDLPVVAGHKYQWWIHAVNSSAEEALKVSDPTNALFEVSAAVNCPAPDYSFNMIKDKITADNMNTLCLDPKFASLCKQGKFNADLNKDGKIDGQDAYIIFKTKQSGLVGNNCGDNLKAPCVYDPYTVCDDGSFRVKGSVVYNKGISYVFNNEVCPYVMED